MGLWTDSGAKKFALLGCRDYVAMVKHGNGTIACSPTYNVALARGRGMKLQK